MFLIVLIHKYWDWRARVDTHLAKLAIHSYDSLNLPTVWLRFEMNYCSNTVELLCRRLFKVISRFSANVSF